MFDLSRITERAQADLAEGEPAEVVIDYEPRSDSGLLRLQAGLVPPAPPGMLGAPSAWPPRRPWRS